MSGRRCGGAWTSLDDGLSTRAMIDVSDRGGRHNGGGRPAPPTPCGPIAPRRGAAAPPPEKQKTRQHKGVRPNTPAPPRRGRGEKKRKLRPPEGGIRPGR